MQNTKKLIAVLVVFNYIISFAYAQNSFCSGGQLQSTVSGLGGNNVPTHMPSIQYQPAFNRFLVSIYNNNQILSQTQCANFPGSSVPQPRVTNFQVLLSCTSNGNTDTGLIGGIQLPSNNSVVTTVASVNVAQGVTFPNIPVVPQNPDQSLADRLCTLTLQATLFCIQGDGNCFPSYNEPIITYTYSTGPSGHFGSCSFGDLTCYADRGILWISSLLWIIVDASFIVITCFFIVPNLYWYLRIKPMDNLRIKALDALNRKNAISYDDMINLNNKQQNYIRKTKKRKTVVNPPSEEELEEEPTILSTDFFSKPAAGKKKQAPSQLFIKDEKTGEKFEYQKLPTSSSSSSSGPSASSSLSSQKIKQQQSQPTSRLTARNNPKQPPKPLDISFNNFK